MRQFRLDFDDIPLIVNNLLVAFLLVAIWFDAAARIFFVALMLLAILSLAIRHRSSR